MRLVWGVVVRVVRERVGMQVLAVTLDAQAPPLKDCEAIAYTALSGTCGPQDRVLLNTTAVDLELGTGGRHMVVARIPHDGAARGVSLDRPGAGRIMKLRYTPLQVDVRSVEELGSNAHPDLATAVDVNGMPVVCCGLHSQVPLVAAGIRDAAEHARVAYVMTDAAALPLALSDVLHAASAAGVIDLTVTSGQAFGGDLEAVTLHSALLAARVIGRADVAIVAIGPGVVGTATPFGHGGVAQGEAINAAACVGARPVACLRLSFADARPRHHGVSHHTLTALGRVALAPARVAVPALEDEKQMQAMESALADSGIWVRHQRVDTKADPYLARDRFGLDVSTMGRRADDDPAFFAAAVGAGGIAAELLKEGAEA